MHRNTITIVALTSLTNTLVVASASAGDVAWAGTYASNQMTFEITAASSTTFTGAIRLNNQNFPLEARLDAGRLLGTFTADGQRFAFTATLSSDQLELLTGGVTFKLTRQESPRPNPLVQAARATSSRPVTRPATPSVHATDTPPARGSGRTPATSSNANTLVLQRTDIFDPMIGCNAVSLLVPKGWKIEGGIGWRQHPVFPTYAAIRIYDPAGDASEQYYPTLIFNDGIREVSMQQSRYLGPEAAAFMENAFPEGGNYLGSEIRRRVHRPVDYVTQFVLPRFRRDLVGARPVSVQDLPDYASAKASAYELDQIPGSRIAASRVRFAYESGGRRFEEDFVCVLWAIPMLNMWSWSGECQSYRAAAGELDRTMPVFRTIDRSVKIDLKWYNAQAQVARMMQENVRQAGEQAVELSRYVSRINDDISDIIRSSYENTQRAMDRCHEKFSNHIRGVEVYQNPFRNHPLEVPAGYDRVFTNPLGEVILTNDHLFDPGTISNQDWRELRPVG